MTQKRLRSHLIFCLLLLWTAWLCVVAPMTTVSAQVAAQVISQTEPQPLQQAKALYEAGRFTDAIAVLQQAVQTYQQQGNSVQQAIALSNLALTYDQLGAWPQANDAIHASLQLLTQAAGVERTDADRRSAQAQALDIQGRLQLAQGQAEPALASWQQAAQYYKQIADCDRLTRNQINQSRALQVLGFYQRAIKLLTELEQTLQAQPDSLTKSSELRSLGEALRVVGNLDQSRQRLQDSLTIAQRLPADPAIAASVTKAIALTQLSLGNTARSQRNNSAALNWYQQAATSSNSEITQLQSNLNRFSLLVEMGQTSDAQALLPQIQRQLKELPLNRTLVYARINLAQSLAKGASLSASSTDAAALLSTAVQQSEQLGDQRTQAYALGLLGGLYEKTQQWSFAADLTRQALQLTLSSNANDGTYLWQWQLGRILKAQAKQGNNPAQSRSEAIGFYEAALNTLQSLRLDLASVNPDQQFSFRESVEPAYRELIELLLQRPAGATASSQADLVRARRTLESLQTVELQNFFREACLDIPISLDRIVEQTRTLSQKTNQYAGSSHLPDYFAQQPGSGGEATEPNRFGSLFNGCE